MKKNVLILFFIFILQFSTARAQFLPIFHYSSDVNSWYEDAKYPHTSLQPFYSMDTLKSDTSIRKYWFTRKLFDEHLYQKVGKQYYVNINFLPDIYIGSEADGRLLWNNTRGLDVNGKVGEHFSFGFQLYETQSLFPRYLDSINLATKAVVGQGWFEPRTTLLKVFDYTYSTAHIAYRVGNFNFQLANDKLFIGDGYRSLLLSDVSIPYPYFKASFESKKFQYSSIYMQHVDPFAPKLSQELGQRKKWAVMHYLNWNISKKWSLGLFDAVIWQDDDSVGKRGFEMSYANPIIFLRAAEYTTGSSDNALIGLNLKYQWNKNNKVYAQLLLDELKIDEYFANKGWWANKFGVQLGLRSANIFRIENLSGFTEFNLVKPFTYTHKNTLRSYTNYGDALAHPLGANFIENVSRVEYAFKRWRPMLQINYALFGLDSANGNTNVGKNILDSYETRDKEYGNKMLQGIPGSLLFVDLRLAYVLNPKTNMRIELGYIYRDFKVDGISTTSNIITFGLRSSFRNLYFDR
jgi:hypothetical protein